MQEDMVELLQKCPEGETPPAQARRVNIDCNVSNADFNQDGMRSSAEQHHAPNWPVLDPGHCLGRKSNQQHLLGRTHLDILWGLDIALATMVVQLVSLTAPH